MNGFLPVLLMFALGATLLILLVGVVGFAAGGRFNSRFGNILMRWRVVAQAVAIALLGLFMLFGAT
ncbi:MAG: hypothetical protein EXR02_06305 [Rhodospirillales bacterium]|nr:hypothetical protein [Rhodospirillales bacterium]MSP80662.1 hypothetical protein [Rhodospirillales bacterium]